MGKQQTHEDYENWIFEKDLPFQVLGKYTRAIDPILHECFEEHQWFATPHNIKAGKGCPYCAGNRKPTQEEYLKKLKSRNISLLEDYKGNRTPIKHICEHQHIWRAIPSNVLKGHGCPQCANIKRTKTHSAYIAQLVELNSELFPFKNELYVKNNVELTHECSEGHSYKIQPHHVLSNPRCTQCVGLDRDHIVYYIRIIFDNTVYYKIGLTFKTVEQRFFPDRKNVDLTTIKLWNFDNFHLARAFERSILKEYKGYKVGNLGILTDGNTEIFSIDVLGLDKYTPAYGWDTGLRSR